HIFAGDYAYFSSYSQSWLAHCRTFAEGAINRFALRASSRVVEIASNDGYLLQYFRAHGIRVQGVEPAKNCAREAEARGIPTVVEFFGSALAKTLEPADLV